MLASITYRKNRLTIFIYSLVRPNKVPDTKSIPKVPFMEKVKSLRYVIPILLVFALIIGGAVWGWFASTVGGGRVRPAGLCHHQEGPRQADRPLHLGRRHHERRHVPHHHGGHHLQPLHLPHRPGGRHGRRDRRRQSAAHAGVYTGHYLLSDLRLRDGHSLHYHHHRPRYLPPAHGVGLRPVRSVHHAGVHVRCGRHDAPHRHECICRIQRAKSAPHGHFQGLCAVLHPGYCLRVHHGPGSADCAVPAPTHGNTVVQNIF